MLQWRRWWRSSQRSIYTRHQRNVSETHMPLVLVYIPQMIVVPATVCNTKKKLTLSDPRLSVSSNHKVTPTPLRRVQGSGLDRLIELQSCIFVHLELTWQQLPEFQTRSVAYKFCVFHPAQMTTSFTYC